MSYYVVDVVLIDEVAVALHKRKRYENFEKALEMMEKLHEFFADAKIKVYDVCTPQKILVGYNCWEDENG